MGFLLRGAGAVRTGLDGFATKLLWTDNLGHFQKADYDGFSAFARIATSHRLHSLMHPETRPLRGKEAVRASMGLGGAALEAQQAACQARRVLRRDRARAARGDDAEDEEAAAAAVEDDGGAAAGKGAQRFFVYKLEPAKPRALIAERPTRKDVEQALTHAKRVGVAMTWAQIVDRHASAEFVKPPNPKIRRDALPLSLKHHGLVLLRQRASDVGKNRRGYLFAYQAPWINRADYRAMRVEEALVRFRLERAQTAGRTDLFGGTTYSGPAARTEDDAVDAVNREVDVPRKHAIGVRALGAHGQCHQVNHCGGHSSLRSILLVVTVFQVGVLGWSPLLSLTYL